MPKELPAAVIKTLDRLRLEYGGNLGVSIIAGNFCVYDHGSTFDKEIGRRVRFGRYLGRKGADGFFIPARRKLVGKAKRMNSEEYDRLYEHFKSDGEIKTNRQMSVSEDDHKFTDGEKSILRALSMNCRISTPYLSKLVGITPQGVRHDISSLEKRLGIRYTLDIDIEKLGFTYYIMGVRFRGKKPEYNEIKEAVDKVPNVQLAMVSSGNYDLLMYVVVENNSETTKNTFYEIREILFPEYESSWYIMLFYKTYGYVPLHEDFFKLLKKVVWTRSREEPRKPINKIWQREYTMLRNLWEDSRQSFTDIDSRNGLALGTTRHAYDSMLEKKVIIRPTIFITRFPVKYNAAIFVEKLSHSKWKNAIKEILHNIIQETSSIDKYALIGDIKNPEGVLYIMPVMNDYDIDNAKESIRKTVESISIESSIITGIPKGMLGYRVYDNKYSNQMRILSEQYRERMPARTDYRLNVKPKKKEK